MEIMENQLSPLEKLHEFLLEFGKGYENVIAMGGCPIFNTASETDDTHPQLKKMVQDIVLRIEKRLVSVIEEGIAQGEISKDTNPSKVAEIIISLIEGGFMMAKLLDNRKYFDNSLEQAF